LENPKQHFFDCTKVIREEKQNKPEIELDNLLQRSLGLGSALLLFKNNCLSSFYKLMLQEEIELLIDGVLIYHSYYCL
jgi:hypothetical protein